MQHHHHYHGGILAMRAARQQCVRPIPRDQDSSTTSHGEQVIHCEEANNKRRAGGEQVRLVIVKMEGALLHHHLNLQGHCHRGGGTAHAEEHATTENAVANLWPPLCTPSWGGAH